MPHTMLVGSFSDPFTRKGKPWKQARGEAKKPSSAGNLPWAGPSCIILSVPRGHLSEEEAQDGPDAGTCLGGAHGGEWQGLVGT